MAAENTLSEAFQVRETEIDRNGKWTLAALLGAIQEVAGTHADRLGCGFQALRTFNNSAWFVSRVQMEIRRMPLLHEHVTLTTWPRGFRRIIANRHTQISVEGEECVRMSTFWALVDLASQRPLPLPASLNCALPDNEDLPEFFTLPPKIRPVETAMAMNVPVVEHMIDRNCHVNNCQYATLATDWLAARLGVPPDIAGFTADYLMPTPPGMTLTVAGNLTDKSFYVEVLGEGRHRFLMEGTLK